MKKYRWRLCAMGLLLVLLCMAVHFSFQKTVHRCFGLPFLSEEAAASVPYSFSDLRDHLTFADAPVPMDFAEDTLYLSVELPENGMFWEMPGRFSLDVPGNLYLLEDPFWDQLEKAVETNHAFTLVWISPEETRMEYDLILTTLPILNLDGALPAIALEEPEWDGTLRLSSVENGYVHQQESQAHWHIRGASSRMLAKKSWKLSLKTDTGENRDLDFLGLGADDDWLLNAMGFDDTKLREPLFIGLWNELSDLCPYDPPMAQGEYVELFYNGHYQGLYYLQRRIDRKYLGLSESEMLFKGLPPWDAASARERFRLLYSTLPEAESYAYLDRAYFWRPERSHMPQNFMDVNLFLQFASAGDNTGFKNTYYLLHPEGGEYRITMIPWDTDLSFGTKWRGWFVYDYGDALDDMPYRSLTRKMQAAYPDWDLWAAARWEALRQGLLSTDHVLDLLDRLCLQVSGSGAILRDHAQWGLFYQGADTPMGLYAFIQERLEFVDAHYAENK